MYEGDVVPKRLLPPEVFTKKENGSSFPLQHFLGRQKFDTQVMQQSESDVSNVQEISVSLKDIAISNDHHKKENNVGHSYDNFRAEMNFVKTNDKLIQKRGDIQFAPENDIKAIIILEAVNPHRFWFCEYTEFIDHKKLRTQICSFYNSNLESFKINLKDMKPGLYVAVNHKNSWRRAKVLKLMHTSQYRVFLVDYGSVVDVDIVNFRYLKEEFLQQSALVHRGVLAYVQPKFKYWSNEATKFFYKRVVKQKINAKIYRISKENSYYMSLKIQVDNSSALPASELINNDYGVKDKFFLYKDPVNHTEISFDDYEEGDYADISAAAALQAVDSWIPKAKTPEKCNQNGHVSHGSNSNARIDKQKSSDSKRSGNAKKKLYDVKEERHYQDFVSVSTSYHERSPKPLVQHPKHMQSSLSNRVYGNLLIGGNNQMWKGHFKRPFQRTPRRDICLSPPNSSNGNSTIVASSLGSSPGKEKVIEIIKWQIESQKFESMIPDREIDIFILNIEKSNTFYFYNVEETHEIKKFWLEFK